MCFLIEKAQADIDEERPRRWQKMKEIEFDFEIILIDESDEEDGRYCQA